MKLFALMLITPLGVIGVNCPEESVIKPCTCDYDDFLGSTLTCMNFDNFDCLQKVFDNSLDYNFDMLELKDCVIPYLNISWVSTKRIEKLFLVNMTLIDLIHNVDITVSSLLRIEIENTKILRGLRWQQFRPFNDLKYMAVEKFKVKKLGKEFRNNVPSSLEQLGIKFSNLETLEDEAFQGKNELKEIFLDYNRIKVLKSSFFKDQRKTLEVMSFRNNPIESIPVDLFEEMPSLNIVDFKGARIKTLSTNLFPLKLKTFFDFMDNPLVCDCNMSWIPKRSHHIDIMATCESPPFLESRALKDLREEDFKEKEESHGWATLVIALSAVISICVIGSITGIIIYKKKRAATRTESMNIILEDLE